MSASLRVRLEPRGEALWVFLDGAIDETSDFSPALGATSTAVTLELSGVTRINSVGVREWLHFIRALVKRCPVTLERCSGAIVEQLDLITNFTAGAAVGSIEVERGCAQCGREDVVTVRCDGERPPPVPLGACGKCSGELRLALEPERLFAFLS